MQWGYVYTNQERCNITYPKPFPHMTSIAMCTTLRSDRGDGGFNYVFNMSRTGFTAVLDESNVNPIGGYWFALGY